MTEQRLGEKEHTKITNKEQKRKKGRGKEREESKDRGQEGKLSCFHNEEKMGVDEIGV